MLFLLPERCNKTVQKKQQDEASLGFIKEMPKGNDWKVTDDGELEHHLPTTFQPLWTV